MKFNVHFTFFLISKSSRDEQAQHALAKIGEIAKSDTASYSHVSQSGDSGICSRVELETARAREVGNFFKLEIL